MRKTKQKTKMSWSESNNHRRILSILNNPSSRILFDIKLSFVVSSLQYNYFVLLTSFLLSRSYSFFPFLCSSFYSLRLVFDWELYGYHIYNMYRNKPLLVLLWLLFLHLTFRCSRRNWCVLWLPSYSLLLYERIDARRYFYEGYGAK